jgi:chain length determinant protein EpsF
MNIKQILLLLKLRWWLMLLLFALIVGASTVLSLVLPKQYTAVATILLDPPRDRVVETFLPNVTNPGYMATQANTISDPAVATRVVKMLGLADNPSAVEQWREATEGRTTLENYYGDLLVRNLRVDTLPQSSMLSVTFTGKDPKFAAAVANAFTKAYLDLSVEIVKEPTRKAIEVFDERMRALRSELQVAQDRLSAFQQKKGIVISTERMDLERQSLARAEEALAAAQAEEANATSRRSGSGSELSADVQQSQVVQNLKSQLAVAETRLREVSEIYGERHPQRIQVDTQVKSLRAQLRSEIDRVTGAADSNVSVAKRRVSELRQLVENQKRSLLSMQAERDEASVLLRDVDAAQKAYDAASQKRASLVNDVHSNQAPAKVLSPAVEPALHSKPNIPKNIALSIVMGLLAGFVAAVGTEFLNRRVRSEDDMLAAEGVPVIGVMSSKPLDARQRILPAPVRHRLGGGPMAPQLTLDGSVS